MGASSILLYCNSCDAEIAQPHSSDCIQMTTEQAEAIGLADYLATCDEDEYVEFFEEHGIVLGSY